MKKLWLAGLFTFNLTEGFASKPMEKATFAMGCFWCGEAAFLDHDTQQPLDGITELTVGYAGGDMPNPTYENHPGYREALQITFDPTVISYQRLLDIFWRNVDPYDKEGQFCDKGFAYTSALFYHSEGQRKMAERSLERVQENLEKRGIEKTIHTAIIAASSYYKAEEYHQRYSVKNPIRYKFYRWNCGRDQRLSEIGL